jgi:uncharacterized protein (TIRG00374 family)
VNRRTRITLIAWSVTLAALGWFLYDLRGEWRGVGEALLKVKLEWVLLASLILLGEFFLRALRWKVLLRPLGTNARIRDMFDAQVIGAAVNTLLPLRAGELAKTLVASRRTGESLVAVVATAVMERVYDLFGLICVLLLMVLALPDMAASENELVHNLKVYGGLFGAFALCCMVIFFLLATREEAARRSFERILSLAPAPARAPFLHLFDGFVSGLGNARDFKGLGQAAVLSFMMWLNGALAIWCLFEAFEMEMPHPFGAACFTGVAIALTVALPQAPGFVGVFHVAMQKTMILWGQADADAFGFAVVFWAVSFLPVTAVGLARLYSEGLRLGQIREKNEERLEDTPEE